MRYRMKNKILVAGGGGFIGSALVDVLCKHLQGRSIRVLGRSPFPKFSLPINAEYIQGDISSEEFVSNLLINTSEIIDLTYSTVPKTSFDDPIADIISNLPASVNLMRQASINNISRYLLVSSGGTVYGPTREELISEDHPTNPISPYGISKLLIEKYANFYHNVHNLPIIIARPSNPYGTKQIGNPGQGFIGSVFNSSKNRTPIQIFGENGTIRDYIHISDLAQGLFQCFISGKVSKTYNFGTGVGTNNLEIIEKMSSLGIIQNFTITFLPSRPFDVNMNILDSSLAEIDFNWKSTIDLDEGLLLTKESL